jgi:DNA repair protein RadC
MPEDMDREWFGALFLNVRHRAIGFHLVSIGTLTSSLVHPRELFRAAILASAVSLVLSHNHPSG